MNNVDPSGLRTKLPRSPSAFVQSADYLVSQLANRAQENSRQIAHSAQSLGRSFRRQVPLQAFPAMSGPNGSTSFDTTSSRPGRRATLVGDKINDFGNMITGGEKDAELPMYKDKPYNYAPSQRRKPIYRRPRTFAVIAVVLLVIFYFSGGSSTIPPPPIPENVREAWKATQLSKPFDNFLKDSKLPTTNWNDRRDRVRDAFKISWAAYEKHGWGA